MQTQSFSIENIEIIYDIENRKKSISNYLGAQYQDILTQIKTHKDAISVIKRKKKQARTTEDQNALAKGYTKLSELYSRKKEIQITELEKIAKKINSDFKFNLQSHTSGFFLIDDIPEAFFAIKKLQQNLSKTFNVKQSNRHLILSQIKLLLNNNSPKYIIRTDILKFFESISQDRLFKKLKANTLISNHSIRLITQIINEFNLKKNKTEIEANRGIPRGVGISSLLSEVYMSDIDNKVKSTKDVIFYARYVDDIFIIISPTFPAKEITTYFDTIKNIIEFEELKVHEPEDQKSTLIDLVKPNSSNTSHSLTYLGYQINVNQRPNNAIETTFGLSINKKLKIQERVLKSILYFNEQSKFDIKRARRNLLLCLRFLTTNTKLTGAKNKVKTGIYYSNDLIDDQCRNDIMCLDRKLEFDWLKRISPYDKIFQDTSDVDRYTSKLKTAIIQRYSFSKGFNEKTFHTFSSSDLKTIKLILR